jgi:hypothetical protein
MVPEENADAARHHRQRDLEFSDRDPTRDYRPGLAEAAPLAGRFVSMILDNLCSAGVKGTAFARLDNFPARPSGPRAKRTLAWPFA